MLLMRKYPTSEDPTSEDPNNTNPELKRYLSIPGVNPDKVTQWFSLGLKEPQTFNQARLLAEAVGYNPEQAKVVAGQWQYESKGGNKVSAPFNYFGIKAHSDAVRNKLAERGIEVAEGSKVATKEGVGQKTKASFMSFGNAFDAFAGHKAFLETNSRYSTALTAADARGMAIALERAGYATAPNYGKTLYNDYIRPKEVNPKSGNTRPKGLGNTKSSSGIITPLQSIEPTPKPLELRSNEPIPELPLRPLQHLATTEPTIQLPKQKYDALLKTRGGEYKVTKYDVPDYVKGMIFKKGGNLLYKKGGTIHIDKSKKGTFTAAATKHGMGVQEFATKVLADKSGKYSPIMHKKANFARNASKFKH